MLLIGHRGAKSLEPENTLLSVRRAMEIGVDAVEIDVRLTKDREVIVIHDETVDRKTNGTGRVCDLTLAEIRGLDAGKGERLPTLQEGIDVTRGKVELLIELKEAGTEETVAEHIRRNDIYESSYVISFWHDLVKKVKEMDSRIRTGVLLVGCPVDGCLARSAGADAFVMKYTFVNPQLVKTAHSEGFKVFIWNIDDRDLVKPYADMEVDGIASNDPRILVDFFRKGAR